MESANHQSDKQSLQQVERFFRKVIGKFCAPDATIHSSGSADVVENNNEVLENVKDDGSEIMTDIHVRINSESGDLMAFDDDDNEITRCVVEEWIENKDDDFYENVGRTLRLVLENLSTDLEKMGILKPFSFVLENEDKESIAELYIVDDDLLFVDPELMKDLDKDLDDFFEKLMRNA